MRTQRSRLIGFLTDEVATTPHAGDIIRGAEEAAWNNEHILLVVSAGDNQERARAAIDTMLEREVEGIIYAAVYHRPVQLPSNAFEVPTVLANCYIENRSLASVVPNEEGGGYEATKVLLDNGHRKIGFINVNNVDPGIPASLGRLKGYMRALEAFGVGYDEKYVRYGEGNAVSGYQFGYDLMDQPDPPTAIFCGNDRTAMGTYDALKERLLRIPEDVAVIGFDNQDIIATALHPTLSTMQLPHYEMGKWALDYLLHYFESSSASNRVQHQLPCPYIKRNSV
jgi:LacI family transcriptional regulator